MVVNTGDGDIKLRHRTPKVTKPPNVRDIQYHQQIGTADIFDRLSRFIAVFDPFEQKPISLWKRGRIGDYRLYPQ